MNEVVFIDWFFMSLFYTESNAIHFSPFGFIHSDIYHFGICELHCNRQGIISLSDNTDNQLLL